MSLTLKRALHWFGSMLAIVGVTFVALRLQDYSSEIDFNSFGWPKWSTVSGLALIYGLSNLMLALAWWNLLKQFGATTSCRWAIRTYGASQIAKYVPGNIFHFAGRQAMGMAAGLAGWPLAKSAVWELGLISASGGVFGLLALPLILPGMPAETGVVGFFAVLGILVGLLWRCSGPPVVLAFGCYAIFLAISGLLFVGLVELLVKSPGNGDTPWLPLVGAYVWALLAGLVTPGAPAGVGVRELVLLFFLKGQLNETDLFFAVLLGRMVTVGGDVMFYLAAMIMNSDNRERIVHD